MKVFSVFDAKANAYLQPFVMKAKPVALRAFEDLVNDPTCAFSKHPMDYTLFYVGDWDQIAGQLTRLEVNEALCNGKDVRHDDNA